MLARSHSVSQYCEVFWDRAGLNTEERELAERRLLDGLAEYGEDNHLTCDLPMEITEEIIDAINMLGLLLHQRHVQPGGSARPAPELLTAARVFGNAMRAASAL